MTVERQVTSDHLQGFCGTLLYRAIVSRRLVVSVCGRVQWRTEV